MKKLRIGYSNTFENAKRFFDWTFSKRFDVIRDDENPNYVIYGDLNFGPFDRMRFPNSKCIFYTGEPVGREYAGELDYAITFDHVNSPKHYRLPLYVVDMWAAAYDDKFTDDFMYLTKRHNLIDDAYGLWMRHEGHRLVSYVQTNPRQKTRTAFVETLLKHDMVDCGGPHLNNMPKGWVVPREGGHRAKLDFIGKRKFNVAFENGARPGYVTEKLLNAFYANTIPIYWGSVTVGRDFNEEAFINANNHESFESVVEEVLKVSNDPEKYCNMLCAPAFPGDVPPETTDLELFLDWFETFVYDGE